MLASETKIEAEGFVTYINKKLSHEHKSRIRHDKAASQSKALRRSKSCAAAQEIERIEE